MEDVTPDAAPEAVDTTPDAPEPSAPGQSAPEPRSAASPPEPTPEPEETVTFDLDSWDGNIDLLPEDLRPVHAAFDKHFQTRIKSDLDELEALRGRAKEFESVNAIYEALMNGEEDPRIDELTTMVARSNVAKQQLEETLKAIQAEYDEFKAQVDAAETAWAERQWADFKASYPKIAANEALVGELLDEGWGLDVIPSLAGMNKKAAEEARRLVKAEGLAPPYAMEIARNRHPDTKETSRSMVVAGATGPTGNAAELERKGPINPSYSDKREHLLNKLVARA